MNSNKQIRQDSKKTLKMLSALTDLVKSEVRQRQIKGLPIPKWMKKTYLECRKIDKKNYKEIQTANPTDAENVMHGTLISLGFKFQHVISFEGGVFYILDFYHRKSRLAVEIDGSVHDTLSQKAYDLIRDERLSKKNIRVFRFTNTQVFRDKTKVIAIIKNELQASQPIPALRISEKKFTYR